MLNPAIKNPNLRFLYDSFKSGRRGVLLEGSSRSGKTWDSIDFIIYLCSSVETNATINIIKESYNSFKTTLYDDFNRRLPDYGLKSPFVDRRDVATFKLFGNKINLLGADDESKFHGASCDYFWCNEMLDVSKAVFDQSEQRCRRFWWGDYNPKVTDHWVYNNVQPRNDVGFLKTTFRDNPRVSQNERRKIESYEPTPENIAQGTADDYLWNVYGLGLRSAPEGLIFQNVNWITEFPKDLERVYYGLDFGYTNSPSALVKVGVGGRDMYVECLFYSPTESPTELIDPIRQHCGKNPVWADPSGRGMIAILRREGLNVLATNTFPGSIKTGLSIMKSYKQNWVMGTALVKEQANYKYRTIDGKPTDDPIDDFNHAIDAARMPVISNLRIGGPS